MAEIKQVGIYKLSTEKILKKDGEKVYLKYTSNDDLKRILKTAVIKELVDVSTSRYGESNPNNLKRYKVKKIIYSCLYGSYKDLLFIKKFIDTGSFKYAFDNLRSLEAAKTDINDNLRDLLKVLLNLDVAQETTFKIKLE